MEDKNNAWPVFEPTEGPVIESLRDAIAQIDVIARTATKQNPIIRRILKLTTEALNK